MTIAAEYHYPAINYRHKLAGYLAVLQLAYFVLIWPLLYAEPGATADLLTAPVEASESNLLNRLFFPASAAISLMLLVAERHRLSRFHIGGIVLFGGFICWFGASFLWALAPSVTISKFALLALQIVVVAVAVLLARRAEDLIRPMFWVMAATVMVNLMALVVVPATPIGHSGIYAHKNTLGAIAALCGIFAIYGFTRSNWRVRAVGFAMVPAVALLLYLSQSKTSLALYLMAPAVTVLALGMHRYLRISLPVTIAVVLIPSVALLGGWLMDFSFRDLSLVITSDNTFTGRTDIWDFAATQIAQRPVTGFGYQSFWNLGDLSPAASLPDGFVKKTPHAHNGYIDLVLQGGFVGLGLFFLTISMVTWWLGRLTDADWGMGLFAATLLVYLLLVNLLETVWIQGLSAPGMLTTLLMLMASVERDRRALT